MRYIEPDKGKRHALRGYPTGLASGTRMGSTECGRIVRGRTGSSIPGLVDCENCKRVLRKQGRTV